ncbi:KTSC domain-containing protein [Luteimonas yindakuii]|nr:KTSC domain-containing protein [Luteimonas yindakuii]
MAHINPDNVPAPATPTRAQAARERRFTEKHGAAHVDLNHVVAPVIATGIELTQINKFHTKGGTGFAAEEANILADRMRGRTVEAVGTSNTLNGPDRIVDGVAVQTKYYDSATRTMESAFNSEGVYRYNGQRLEVPADQYDTCLERMRAKIAAGKVPGVTDPAQAEEIVKKGSVSYAQARNIARAGTIDGLIFDAKTHAVGAGLAVGLSFAIHYAQLKWNGVETEAALKEATFNGLGSGTLAFTAGIATSQVLRTKAAAVGVVLARDAVKSVQSTQFGKVIIEKIAAASLGKSVYGAAARNHVAKLMRSNVVTSVVVTAVMTTPDLYRASFAKSMSWKQLGKNLAVNSTSVVGGTGGWIAGAAAGAAVGSAVPLIGTAVGGVVGGIVGSLTGGTIGAVASKKAMDLVVDDDSVKLMPLIQEEISQLAYEYMLSAEEMGELVDHVSKNVRTGFLRDLYAATDRSSFIRSAFEPKCEEMARARSQIRLPDASAIDVAVADILHDVLDGSLEASPV